MNNITTIGHYSLSGTFTNAPISTLQYAQLYVLETKYTWIVQILIQGTEGWYRFAGNSSEAFSGWTKILDSRNVLMTAGTVSSLPVISKSGTTVTIEFANQISAGTYGNGLWTAYPPPKNTTHFVVEVGGTMKLMRIQTSGRIDFNNSETITGNPYIIGSVTYGT